MGGSARGGGQELLPLLSSSGASWRSGFLVEHYDSHVVKVPTYCAVRNRNYIYVEYGTGEEELYDLTGRLGPADPYELQNQASNPDYAARKAALHQRLISLCKPPPPGFTP